jgi:hypothetical protein
VPGHRGVQTQPNDVKYFSVQGSFSELLDAHAFAIQLVTREEVFDTQVHGVTRCRAFRMSMCSCMWPQPCEHDGWHVPTRAATVGARHARPCAFGIGMVCFV